MHLAALLTIACTVSCTDLPAAPPTTPETTDIVVVGTYNLSSVDRAAPPGIVTTSTQSLELVDGQITVNANGTFTDSTNTVDLDTGTPIALVAKGTYQRAGNVLTFIPTASGSYNLTADGQTLTQTYYSDVLGYTRVR